MKAPQSPTAEACRFLGAHVRPGNAGQQAGSTVCLVTSPGPRDGKSTIAANLAAAIAESGTRVVLLDANLHRPTVHQFFDLPNRAGLSDLLADANLGFESVLQATAIPSLRVLTSGPLPPNPASALASRAMAERLRQIRALAEVIVLDSAALLGAADASVLARLSDEVVMVVRVEQTRRATTRQAIGLLGQVGVRVLGIVLNGRNVGRASYRRYYAVATQEVIPTSGERCPELGLRQDRSSIVLAPSGDHRCNAGGQSVKVSLEHQRAYCLCGAYATCHRLARARRSIRVDEIGPTIGTPPRMKAGPAEDTT